MFLGITNFSGVDKFWTNPTTLTNAEKVFKQGKVICAQMFHHDDPRNSIDMEMCSQFKSIPNCITACKFRTWNVTFQCGVCLHPNARELEAETELEIALEKL